VEGGRKARVELWMERTGDRSLFLAFMRIWAIQLHLETAMSKRQAMIQNGRFRDGGERRSHPTRQV